MLGGRLSTGMCDWCKVTMHKSSNMIDPFFIIMALKLNLMIPEYSNNNLGLFIKKAGLLLKTPL
jgi:hypothetical protein